MDIYGKLFVSPYQHLTTGKEKQMEPTKICVFCESWESGGIESFLCNVLLQMDLEGLEVDLVTDQLKESVFTQRLKDHGIRFRELSGSQKNVAKNRLLFRNLLQKRQYDVLHLNIFQGMSLYYAHLAKEAGVPVRIAHSHNTDLRKSCTREIKLWLHRHYSDIYAKDATTFWACSEMAAKFMFPQQLLAERGFTFVPNGIDTARFRFDSAGREVMRRKLGVENQFVIGNVGRLCYQKNQTFLLDVLVEVLKRRPESCLLLVGDGDERQMLEEKATSLGIREHVIFYGVTKEVERLFWAMDVFAFPSLFEGLGIVAVEAQATGLPVVCSEYVPAEAHVVQCVQKVMITQGSAAWSKAILEIQKQFLGRAAGVESVQKAGFDVVDVSSMIFQEYVQ